MVLLFPLYSEMSCCSFPEESGATEGDVFWKLSQLRSYILYLFVCQSWLLYIYIELKCALKSEFYSFSFAFKKEKRHIYF